MQSRTMSQLSQDNSDIVAAEQDSITNRVAGLTCLYVLNGHSGVVSGLALAETNDHVYLISVGWDSVICVWDLKTSSLLCQMKHTPMTNSSATTTPTSSTSDLFPRDSIITYLDYCKDRNLFAFSTSDKTVHVHQFSTKRQGMKLVATLSGHFNEVTQVKWNSFMKKWVTASEDGTIRTWAPEGGDDCEQFVRVGQPVSLITIDKTYGFILATTNIVIRIYDCKLELIQVSRGHEDCIRDIVHIPELDHHLSTGWDNAVRIWKAHHPKGSQHVYPTQQSMAT